MHRRFASSLVAATLVVAGFGLAFPVAAVADGDVTMLTPADGETITGRVSMVIEIKTHPVDEVTFRLSQDDQSQAPGTGTIPVPCIQNCQDGPTTRWGDRTFDPVNGAPFTSAGICNGTWTLQARLDKGEWISASAITVSAPPAVPTDVSVLRENSGAVIRWTASRSPDVVGYQVERATSDSAWSTVAEVGASDTIARDNTVVEGTHRYRVTALRPDGFVNGKPAVPCADQGRDLKASSKETPFTYGSSAASNDPRDEPSGSPSSESGGTSSGSDDTSSDAGSTAASGDPSASGSSSGGDDSSTTSDASEPESGEPTANESRRPARAVAPAPAPRRQTDGSLTTPELGAGEVREDVYYYGQDDDFTGEINYGDTEVVAGGEQELIGYDEDGEPIYRTVPGGTQAVFLNVLDAAKMRTLALGLLLVALAAHGRRWVHAG
ncbi:MAG: hypothetical protein ACI867_000589 [Glaciecola sp.]